MSLRSHAPDWGAGRKVRVHIGSSAAQGIRSRSGLGKVRHLAVSQLSGQEPMRGGAVSLHKCRGATTRPTC